MSFFEEGFFPRTQTRNNPPISQDHIPAYLKTYFTQVESVLSFQDRETLKQYFDYIVHDADGRLREYDEIAEDIFFLREVPALAAIEAQLQETANIRLRDYLASKVDVLFGRHLIDSGNPTDTQSLKPIHEPSEVQKAIAEETAAQYEERAQEQNGNVTKEAQPVSQMNLEALLSKATIGRIEAPISCQCNDGFCLPTLSGMERIYDRATVDQETRFAPQLIEQDAQPSDLLFELPIHRIRDSILPVPAGYEVLGSLDEDLSLIDPHPSNPFCTRVTHPLQGRSVRYVVRRRAKPVRIDDNLFSPSESEVQQIKTRMPFQRQAEKHPFTDFVTAKEAIADEFREKFLYCCDDRIGAFIARHPKELSTIVNGLRIGHCDILAWTAAMYFRQFGHTALVVNTEISTEDGTAFHRDMGHSRVGIIKSNGLPFYFDPTQVCKTIEGYSLSHIENQTIQDLEKKFDAASSQAEKHQLLQAFRKLIDERETISRKTVTYEEGRVPSLEQYTSILDELDLTDHDLNEFNDEICSFKPGTLSSSQRQDLNTLLRHLADKHLPLSMDALQFWRFCEDLSKAPLDEIDVMQDSDPGINLYVMTHEEALRRFCPQLVDEFYDLLSRDGLKSDATTHPLNARMISTAIQYLPPLNALRKLILIGPRALKPQIGTTYSDVQIRHHFALLKLVAAAYESDEIRMLLKHWKVDRGDLERYAPLMDGHLTPNAKPKKTTTTLQAFSGKTNLADLEVLKARAKQLAAEFTVDTYEHRAALSSFLAALSKIPLQPDTGTTQPLSREHDSFDLTEEEYRPESGHTLDMIDQEATMRRDALTVLVDRRAPEKKQTLYIHLDVESSEGGTSPINAHYARVRVALEAILLYSKHRKVIVHLSSANNDYLVITPQTKLPLDATLFRLLLQRADRGANYDEFSFSSTSGPPKNFLYLSCNQGKVNAVKYTLGKKMNVISKNFADVGLDIFPRVREKETVS